LRILCPPLLLLAYACLIRALDWVCFPGFHTVVPPMENGRRLRERMGPSRQSGRTRRRCVTSPRRCVPCPPRSACVCSLYSVHASPLPRDMRWCALVAPSPYHQLKTTSANHRRSPFMQRLTGGPLAAPEESEPELEEEGGG
jgi:hypothetical protein